MFDITSHQDIILHLHNISFIYKMSPKNDWIQILCPYCDDKTRHNHINHGHFYISRFFNYCHCFRCDTKLSIKKLLLDTGYGNIGVLNSIFKTNSNYNYNSENITNISKFDISKSFSKFDSNKLMDFEKYIETRLLNVNYDKFRIYPSYDEINNTLLCNFNNYYNEFSAARVIYSNKLKFRYIKRENSKFYYFQNPFDYNAITICEGPFDIINLYNYSNMFNNSCYFSINGKSYITSTIKIVSEFYLSNQKLKINIVFDSDIKNTKYIEKRFLFKLNNINSNITFKFYKPQFSKDVSDILMLEEI